MSDTSNPITVDETRLELMLANFKLELFKDLTSTYATREQLRELQNEVKEVRVEVATLRDRATGDIAVSKNRQRLLNAGVAIAAAVIGSLIFILGQGGFH